MSSTLELPYCEPVPTLNHLIKKECVPCTLHLPHNRPVSTKPGVALLADRRVDAPLVSVNKIWECRGIAVLLTCCVGDAMLSLEVKDVDG